jgi:starvation-inducible DNA-binding protein
MMYPKIGLSEEQRAGVTRILNIVLADEYVLYTKTRNFHWNVVGPHFHALHKFFDEQYTRLDTAIDEVAERVRAVGGNAIGTLAELREHARLSEAPGEYPDARGMVLTLLADHEGLAECLRHDLEEAGERYGDVGTNDFLTGLLEQHETMAWMLRATASHMD